MRTTWAFRVVLFALVCAIAAVATMVRATASSSASPAPAAPMSRVAGTVSTSVVVNRFRAIGRKVVGLGTDTTTYTDANGVKSVKRKHFWMSIRSHRVKQGQQASAICQILFLEIGEVDLTLAGLHAFLRAANPDEPIRLRLQADDAGGILGRLFCDLASSRATLATHKKAVRAARLMTKRVHRTTVLRTKATIYAPNQSSGTGLASAPRKLQADECPVLHLVLGPVHLELLGLIADLNKIVLDLTAVPGTLLGNIFCQLVTPPSPAGASVG